MKFNVEKSSGNLESLENSVFLNEESFKKILSIATVESKIDSTHVLMSIANKPVMVTEKSYVKNGFIAVPGPMRIWARLALNSVVELEPLKLSSDCCYADRLEISIETFDKSILSLNETDLIDFCQKRLMNHVIMPNQILTIGSENWFCKATVEKISKNDNDTITMGFINQETNFIFNVKHDNILLEGSSKNKIFKTKFNFKELGIGGLDEEFLTIFRRAFASRIYSPELLKQLSITHVRGLLLYGPPGTGKTLIARQIGKALHAKEPKIVNGPEILNKYVGQSEENLRNLFADAEEDQKKYKERSPLHIIIFDEIDAICKQRGSAASSGGVNDSMVNQLLSKIDGVNSLDNILIIGMTNRLDMLDEALLRPGRFEVHIEIGLPDVSGRRQILDIHTSSMREKSRLENDVDLDYISEMTQNYSGAELAGLVRSAVSYAFSRNIDPKEMKPLDEKTIKITKADFNNALGETKPAFGAATDDLENRLSYGYIIFSPSMKKLVDDMRITSAQLRNSANLISTIIFGKPGSGKSSTAISLALKAKFPFVRMISADKYIGYHESQKIMSISKTFDDAYKSEYSVLIIDDIERLVDYTPIGPRFSNNILQALYVLVTKPPPKDRHLLIIGTSSTPEFILDSDLMKAFNLSYKQPQISDKDALEKCMFSHLEKKLVNNDLVTRLSARLYNSNTRTYIPVKKLFLALDMASEKCNHKELELSAIIDCLNAHNIDTSAPL